MINGNEEIIWGFLDDVWHWHYKKISPYDPAHANKKDEKRKLRASLPRAPVPSNFRAGESSTGRLPPSSTKSGILINIHSQGVSMMPPRPDSKKQVKLP